MLYVELHTASVVGADDRQQQGRQALLLRAPEAALAVGWTVAAEELRARFLGAESTASAEFRLRKTLQIKTCDLTPACNRPLKYHNS